MTDTATLPEALASVEQKPFGLVKENGSYCLLHGAQEGLNCPKCDEHFPEQVKAREVGVPAGVAVGYTKAEVDAMVKKAIEAAMKERAAFDQWKASTEGQEAAKAAKTAGQATPDHGPEGQGA